MAELKHALEASQYSICSLESKLENLKSETGGDSNINNTSSWTESPLPSQKSLSKDSKDGLSAVQARPSRSEECEIPSLASAEEKDMETKRHVLPIVEKGATVKKTRGKRKRKESSAGESGFLELADAMTTSDCGEASFGSSVMDNRSFDDLLKLFNSIAEHKCASTFRHRLDSQKRGRYKMMIKKHMDFDTLRLRITNRSIASVNELFRDLLLVANNAVIFYSKNTREHKSAIILRDLTTETMKLHFHGVSKTEEHVRSKPSLNNTTLNSTPVKPRRSPEKSSDQKRRVGCRRYILD